MTRLHLSAEAMKGMGRDPESIAKARAEAEAKRAEEEAERKREREEREAARRRERDAEQAKRDRAIKADQRLAGAIDTYERIAADTRDRARMRDRRLAEADEIRLRIRRMEENLAAEREKLEKLEHATRAVVDDGLGDAKAAIAIAWEEHEAAWSALPKGYVKKNRDRGVRRRMRGLNLG